MTVYFKFKKIKKEENRHLPQIAFLSNPLDYNASFRMMLNRSHNDTEAVYSSRFKKP